MHRTSPVLAGTLLALACQPAATSDGRLRILCLGDSITQADHEHASYRYPLWERLTRGGAAIDFVGSTRSHHGGTPSYPDPAFDPDHEGHWGWRADEVQRELPDWLRACTADVVLLHIGTNDAGAGQPTAETLTEIASIVAALRADNPSVGVFLARIIPTGYAELNLRIEGLNTGIDGLATNLDRPDARVIAVDQWTGFEPNRDTYDGIHPNPRGEARMAARWHAALIAAGLVPPTRQDNQNGPSNSPVPPQAE